MRPGIEGSLIEKWRCCPRTVGCRFQELAKLPCSLASREQADLPLPASVLRSVAHWRQARSWSESEELVKSVKRYNLWRQPHPFPIERIDTVRAQSVDIAKLIRIGQWPRMATKHDQHTFLALGSIDLGRQPSRWQAAATDPSFVGVVPVFEPWDLGNIGSHGGMIRGFYLASNGG